MNPRRAAAALAAMVMVLLPAACQAPEDPTSDGQTAAADDDPEIATPQVSPPPSGPGAPGEDPHGDLACDEETLAAIDDTIAGQLEAFAAGDYAAALEFASRRFRSSTDAETFRMVIEADYPVLTDAAGHTSSLCVEENGMAQLLVSVEPAGEGAGAQELVYTMLLEDGTWRIDTAGSPRGGLREDGGDPVEV